MERFGPGCDVLFVWSDREGRGHGDGVTTGGGEEDGKGWGGFTNGKLKACKARSMAHTIHTSLIACELCFSCAIPVSCSADFRSHDDSPKATPRVEVG